MDGRELERQVATTVLDLERAKVSLLQAFEPLSFPQMPVREVLQGSLMHLVNAANLLLRANQQMNCLSSVMIEMLKAKT